MRRVKLPKPSPVEWEDAETATIDEKSFYFVQNNGMEWSDHDLLVIKGIWLKEQLKPNYVRGRPVWIAKFSTENNA